MKSKRFIGIFAGVALVGVCAWYTSRPAPSWYVSPSLDTQGRHARVRIPTGWRLDTHASHLPHGVLKPDDRFTLVFAPQGNSLSRGLRRLLGRPAVDTSRLYVELARDLSQMGYDATAPVDGKEVCLTPPILPPGWDHISYRLLKAGHPAIIAAVAFTSPDKQTFDAMHTSAVRNVRIEP